MDKRDFGRAYKEYSDAIFRHCYFRVYDRDQAKDLTQQAFAKTWEYLRRGKVVKNIRAFLYQTVRNLIVDYYRLKKTTSLDNLLEDGFEPAGNAGKNPQQELENEEIRQLLRLLREEDREIITMRYIDELKPREIASILNKSANVISVRLTRAKKAFAKVCKKNGYQL